MMEGTHKRGRSLKDVVVGSREEAAMQRQRAQEGAAAAGRVGEAVKRARATSTSTSSAQAKRDRQIQAEVSKSLKKSNGLVRNLGNT